MLTRYAFQVKCYIIFVNRCWKPRPFVMYTHMIIFLSEAVVYSFVI